MARIINLANLQQFTAINALGTDLGAIPGPVVIPQCAQIVLNWSLADGKTAHNVLYGRYSGAFSGSQAQANSILTALTTGAPAVAAIGLFSSTTILSGVSIRNVSLPDQPMVLSSGAAVPGTAATPTLPSEVAVVITERTAKVGRANRGRIFLPPLGNGNSTTADVIAAGALTILQNWANTFISALAAGSYTLVIGQRARAAYTSQVTGRAFPARAATSEAVTSLSMRDNHWDSQRRRGLK